MENNDDLPKPNKNYSSPYSEPGKPFNSGFYPIVMPMQPLGEEEAVDIKRAVFKKIREEVSTDDQGETRFIYNYHADNSLHGHWINDEHYAHVFEKGDFTQVVKSERGDIRTRVQDVTGSGGVPLTGKKAVMAIRAAIGQGKPTRIPLWASGLTFTVGAFKESEILEMEMALAGTRIEMAYDYSDIHFSATDSQALADVVDFILQHVTTTNIRDWEVGDITTLKKLLKVTDIPALIAGALSSIYPAGYPITLRCKNEGLDICNHKASEIVSIDGYEFKYDSLLDFKKVIWVNNKALSQAAIRHMAAREETYTVEQIETYQKSIIHGNGSDPTPILTIDNCKISVVFDEPSFHSYQSAANIWLTDVRSMVDRALTRLTDEDPEELKAIRSKFIQESQAALRLQRHASWIKEIVMVTETGDEEGSSVNEVKDLESIMETLEVFADEPSVEKDFISVLEEYKTSVQITYTGIPSFKCPSCGEDQVENTIDGKPRLIAMNMVDYFFTTMLARWERAGIISTRRPKRVNVVS